MAAHQKIPPVPKSDLALAYVLSTTESGKKGPIRVDTVGSKNPKYLSTSKFYALSMRSRRYLGDGMGYVDTQYVPGADTIYVNDYLDMDGKPRLGLRSQGYNLDLSYEQAVRQNIGFKFGILNLAEYGNDPSLAEFIATHETNAESAAGKNALKNRTVVRLITFRPLRAEANATKRTVRFEENFAGMEILASLREKKGDGTFNYKTAKMNAIYTILDLPNKITASEPAQRFEEIMRVCMQNPEEFANIVTDSLKETEIMLGKAFAGGALVLTAKTASFKFSDKDTQEIMKFGSGVEKEHQITELAYHLLGDPALRSTYTSMRATTEQLESVAA